MLIVGHNLVSDLSTLVKAGHSLPPGPYFCTETASQWLYPDQPDQSLEHLTLRMTNMGSWRKRLGKVKFADFDQMPDDELAERCGGDAEAPTRLYPILDKALTDAGLRRIWNLAMEMLPILALIGGRGMAVDTEGLEQRAGKVGTWLVKEKADLERVLGIEKLNSHKQLSSSLFGPRFNAQTLRETKTTGWSTDRLCLLWAQHVAREQKQHDLDGLLTRLLTCGIQSKLHSTYYEGWLKSPHPGRVVSTYSLGKTATRRLASSQVNLQNVPLIIRELVVPSPGYDCIVAADFGQLEWRVAAHVTQDPMMLRWIREGKDAHSLTAARALGLAEPNTPKEFERFKEEHAAERATGKMANFAILFGIEAESLSWKVFEDTAGETWLPPSETQRYLDAFFKTFSGYQAYNNDLYARILRGEWITSETGRRWQFEANPAGWRKGKNYPVQSLASDLTLMALKALHHRLRRWKSRIIGEVHDSIIFETTKRELASLVGLVRGVCEHIETKPFGFELSVPLAIDIQCGRNWKDLKPVNEP